MNVYDFDKTIYRKDSSVDFYFFNLKKNPTMLLDIPAQLFAMLSYKLGLIDKTEMKSRLYRYFRRIPDIHGRVLQFWDSHEDKIFPYYHKQKRSSDIIISASPEFLLKPICDSLGVQLLASRVDPRSGQSEENCYGPEKVKRFDDAYPDATIHQFYSDSLSDTPMAEKAIESFLVLPDQIIPWPQLK